MLRMIKAPLWTFTVGVVLASFLHAFGIVPIAIGVVAAFFLMVHLESTREGLELARYIAVHEDGGDAIERHSEDLQWEEAMTERLTSLIWRVAAILVITASLFAAGKARHLAPPCDDLAPTCGYEWYR